MARARLWIAGIVAVLLLIVFFQNQQPAQVSVLLWSWEVRLIAILTLSAVMGALVGALVTLALLAWRKRKQA